MQAGSAFLTLLAAPFDAAYAFQVERSRRRWERLQHRDAAGVLVGAAPFSVGEGPTAVVAVHGFADSPAVWRPMAERLARAGLHVHAARLAGAAEPCEQAADVTLGQWVAELTDTVTALRANHARVWLMGHSLGATLALAVALAAPATVDGLVLLTPLVRVSRRRSPLLSPEAWFRLLSPCLRRTRWLASPFGVQAQDRTLASALPRDAFFPLAVYRALFAATAAIEGRAAELRAPLLAVTSAHDRTVDPDVAEAFAADCASVRKSIVRRTDCGHAMPVDNGWEQLADDVAAFVRG